jgi:hypothetical protein
MSNDRMNGSRKLTVMYEGTVIGFSEVLSQHLLEELGEIKKKNNPGLFFL